MHVYLETERVVLRRFAEADADLLVELDSDPGVIRFPTGNAPTPRHVIEDEILPDYLRHYERGEGYGFWAAIEKATGDFLGWFHLRPADDADLDVPELGYRLRRPAWGKGYATEVSRALIHKAFVELGVRRVIAYTSEDNIASRRVLEKSGMSLVRTIHLSDEDLLEIFGITSPELFQDDGVEYALEKADWERQRANGAHRAPSTDDNDIGDALLGRER